MTGMSNQVLDLSIIDRLEKLGGKKLKTDLIQMYLDKTQDKMDIIHTGMKNAIYSDIEGAAHSLISSAGNLGGRLVSGLAVQLEAAAMEENMDRIAQLLPELDQAEKALQSSLRVELEKK